MAEIEDLVGNIEDYKQRLVVKYKFLEFMTLNQIADEMNYSLSQVKRYYRKGIENIKTPKSVNLWSWYLKFIVLSSHITMGIPQFLLIKL